MKVLLFTFTLFLFSAGSVLAECATINGILRCSPQIQSQPGPVVQPSFDNSRGFSGPIRQYSGPDGTSATSQRFGNLDFYRDSNGVTGTTQRLGNFDYSNFSDGTNCTTQHLQGQSITNCR